MSQQDSKKLLIKRETETPGTFEPVCGVRTRSLTISNAQVDTTVPPCDGVGPVVNTAKPGRQTITFTGDGLFDNAEVGIKVTDDARLQRTPNYQIIVPGYGTFTGPFMVGDYELSGDGANDDPLAFSGTWVPTDASQLDFVAEGSSGV